MIALIVISIQLLMFANKLFLDSSLKFDGSWRPYANQSQDLAEDAFESVAVILTGQGFCVI